MLANSVTKSTQNVYNRVKNTSKKYLNVNVRVKPFNFISIIIKK